MTRTALPLLLLAEPVAKRQSAPARLTFGDTAFLITALVLVAGGCLWMLDLASARSAGHEPYANHLFTNLANALHSLPHLMGGTGKYLLLLVASIVNSGLIAVMVYSLRSLDRGVRRAANRASFTLTPLRSAQNIYRPRGQAREAASYLLSPIFR